YGYEQRLSKGGDRLSQILGTHRLRQLPKIKTDIAVVGRRVELQAAHMGRAGILSWEVVQRGEKLNLVTDLVSRDGMRERGSCLYIHICGLGHHAAKQSNSQSIHRWGKVFF